MKRIPILNIHQFEQEIAADDFYSNNLSNHFRKNKELVHKPHTHNFFLCVLFTKGSGIHEIDFNSYTIQPGSVFFLKPGQTHYWKFENAPEGYIFFHSQDFYDLVYARNELNQFPFYSSHKNPPTISLSPREMTFLQVRFKEINDEYYLYSPYKNQKLAGLLNITYIDLARLYTTLEPNIGVSSSTYIKTLRDLEATIDEFYKTEKSAKFYANKLNISSKHLNRITKTTLDKTTTEIITERILLESKRLIVHTDNSLATIGQILGYEDYAYFSKVFKAKTKHSPLEFKKKYY